MNNLRYSAIVSAIGLLVIATSLKLIPWVPNIALFGALSIFCGAYLRGPLAWIIPLTGIAASDFLGEWLGVRGVYRYTTSTMLLNYLGFAAMIAVAHFLRRKDSWDRILGTSLAASVAFFVISNFGCWIDPIMNYAPTWAGFVDCYVKAIPFFRNTLISDMIGVTAVVAVHQAALYHQTRTASQSA